MTRNFRFNRLLLPTAMLFAVATGAPAQTTILPEPFAGVYAGQPTATPTVCPTSLPDSNNNSGPTTLLLGNGCLPSQAIIADVYDVKLDSEGNVYIGEENTTITLPNSSGGTTSYQSGVDIRVVYNGGTALYNALVAANPNIPNFNPLPGHIYTLAGSLTASISATNSHYYCGGTPTYSAIIGYDALGDGCPAAQSRITPRGMAIDNDGNVIFANFTSKYGTRVIYVGGTKMYNLIKLLNPSVITPQVGYIYQLGFGGTTGAEGDGGIATNAAAISPRYVAVDSNENVYMSDGTSTGGTPVVSASGENVRMINGTTGIVTTVAGETTCGNTTYVAANGCPYGYSGDGGPATSALFNYPFAMALDQYNNLFISDYTNARIRVLYRGGTLAGISNPVVGNIYTYFGGNATSGVQGTLTVDNSPAQNVKLTSPAAINFDKAGNLYVIDNSSHYLWRVDAITGIANIVAGGTSSTGTAHAGAFCSGTSGPVSTDNFADGCPAILAYIEGQGSIPFDSQGNFYLGSNNTATSTTPTLFVYKFNYNNQFPATAVGSSATQYMAFTSTVANTGAARSFLLDGASSTEFSDAGGTACTPTTAEAVKYTCVVSVKFTPARPGVRFGAIQLATSGVTQSGLEYISGTGVGSDIAIDNGTVSTLGTGITPSGVAADQLGNIYVADSKGGQLLKGASTGTTLAPLATPVTGLKNPSQVAVDSDGNVYVADTGNNRILVSRSFGITAPTILGTGLSGPKGVAVDQYGNIFVADTGNNRILQLALNGTQNPFILQGLVIPLAAPTQLAFDPTGNLYVLDSGNNRIVEDVILNGITSPIALDPGVVPTGLSIDTAGDIYVADATSKSVLDYYGGATPGFGLVVGFVSPVGLAVDPDGNLFTADTGLTGAIELRRSLGNIVFPNTNPGATTKADITVDNVGNAPLNFQTPLVTLSGANSTLFSVAPGTTNGCGAGTPFAAGSSCNFIGSFSPLVAGTDSATATFNTGAANTTVAVAQLSGTSVALPVPTTTTITVSPAGGVFYSQSITLTVVLTATPITTTPTGTFTLTVDGKTDEPPVAVGNGTVVFTLNLPVGTHQMTVTYSGGSPYASSAAAVTVPVQPAVTTTSLLITPQSVNGIASLLFTSTVGATTAVGQTGTVTIWAGPVGTGTVICSSPISGPTAVPAYSIACTIASLTFLPSNVFTAAYSGSSNGNFAPSQSAAFSGGGGDFIVAPVLSAFTIPQGGVGQLNVNVVSLYGSAGTVTTGCTGLPANSVCRFTPNSITLGSNETPVAVLVQIYTNVSSSLASNEIRSTGREIVLALGLPLGFGLLLMRRRAKLRLLAMLVLGVSMVAGVSGCSGTASLQTFSTLTTPTGTYTINLIFTGASGETAVHSTPASFTVLPAPTD